MSEVASRSPRHDVLSGARLRLGVGAVVVVVLLARLHFRRGAAQHGEDF